MLFTRVKHAIDKRDMTSKMRLVTLKKFFNFNKMEIISLRLIVRINNIMSIKVLSTVSGMYEIFNECYFPKKIWKEKNGIIGQEAWGNFLECFGYWSFEITPISFLDRYLTTIVPKWLMTNGSEFSPTDMIIVLYDFRHEKEGNLWL